MFNIMVVDDEKSVREGMCKYLKRQEGLFDQVFSAVDGLDALEQMKEEDFQVILTDINMPHMNGLDFIEKLNKEYKKAKIIVLSGYDDFSYAQRAMKNGVDHYLLKPIDRKELLEVLRGMKEEYLKEEANKENYRQEREHLQKQQQLLCNRLVHIMLNAPVDRNKWRYELEMMGLWNEQASYFTCIVNNEIAGEDKDTRRQEVEKIRTLAVSCGMKMKVLMESEGESILLIEVPFGKNAEANIEKQFAQKCIDSSKTCICFGKMVDSISRTNVSYHVARKDMEKELAHRELSEDSQVTKNVRELQWQLSLYIKTGQKDRIADCLKQLVLLVHEEKEVYIRMITKETLLIVCSSLEECMGKKQQDMDMMLRVGPYCGSDYLAEWASNLAFIIEKEMELSEDDSLKQQEAIAERALRLIQSRWNQPELSLNQVAAELYVSHNYLRYLIKQKTGMSFVKYLTEVRLERASVMIGETDMKVQDVALSVGFEDPGYFTRIFTKKYGCSPSKYREK